MALRSRNSQKAGPGARPIRGKMLLLGVMCSAFSAGGTVWADETGLALSGPWFRQVMPSLPAAGYFTLSNSGAMEQTLTGAASPACGMLMLHRSVDWNGRSGWWR